jgi:hypothetical protein
MKMTDLYVVNTDTDTKRPFPGDLFHGVNHPGFLEGQKEFFQRVRSQYKGFGFPYIALIEDRLSVIYSEWSKGVYCVTNEVVPGGAGGNYCALEEFIVRYREGNETKLDPITAVVEFSPEELYPEVMEKLGQKYDIRRIFVE